MNSSTPRMSTCNRIIFCGLDESLRSENLEAQTQTGTDTEAQTDTGGGGVEVEEEGRAEREKGIG